MSENKYVTDIIKDDYIMKWNKKDIILIKAPTGSGKTYFIKNKLIPDIKGNILYLCHRVALKRQFKKDLFDFYDIPIPVTNIELDKAEQIENVTVKSYQSLSEMLNIDKEINFDCYDYVVCDECHSLLDEAEFNNKIAYVANYLINKDMNICKIFITATPDLIERYIELAFKKQQNAVWGNNYNKLYKYTCNKNYDYITANAYKKINDIIEIIKTDESNNKWLVFVANKKDGYSILEGLKGIKTAAFLTKDNKQNKEYESIVNKSKFKADVLIATKVLDAGINIEDEQVKNIVIDAWDKNTFLQELGRVRVDKTKQNINLYIKDKGKKNFDMKLKTMQKTLEQISLFKENRDEFNLKYHNDLDKINKQIFMLDEKTNAWKINEIGLDKFEITYKFINDIFQVSDLDKNVWLDIVLNWIDKKFNDLNEYFDEVEKKNNIEFYLENHLGKRLYKEDRQQLIEILNIRDSARRLQKSIGVINSYLLNNYNITCISKRFKENGKKTTIWILNDL